MKIVQINTTCGIGSTGKICVGISRVLSAEGFENWVLCSRANDYALAIPCADSSYIKLQAAKAKLLGSYGFYSKKATGRMIAQLERIQPDIVHLHNIHGHDCNLEMLFSYFKEKRIKLVWTFHDCWAFTAYCPHFTMAKCDKWKSECRQCTQRRAYSWLFDRSSKLFARKKALFSGLDMTIVTPSQWLADMVKQSFLKDYPVHVVHNGIDLTVFQPTDSDFRQRHDLQNKKVVLGVSFGWDARKGLDVFVELAGRLPSDYQIVLVGTDEQTDRQLPENILSIHRTQNQQELAEIYSAADVFVIPTREENYPTVNMEALACGTPVLTFRTGGSPEIIDDSCGSIVPCDDVDAMEREVRRICTQMPYSQAACLQKAREFDQTERFKEYVDILQGSIA